MNICLILRTIVELERHRLGPRIHVFGRRIHEYQCGFAIVAFAPLAWFQGRPGLALASGAGLWLVVKDWPDLFPATRDKASWGFGVHRLPSCPEPGQRVAVAGFAGDGSRRSRDTDDPVEVVMPPCIGGGLRPGCRRCGPASLCSRPREPAGALLARSTSRRNRSARP